MVMIVPVISPLPTQAGPPHGGAAGGLDSLLAAGPPRGGGEGAPGLAGPPLFQTVLSALLGARRAPPGVLGAATGPPPALVALLAGEAAGAGTPGVDTPAAPSASPVGSAAELVRMAGLGGVIGVAPATGERVGEAGLPTEGPSQGATPEGEEALLALLAELQGTWLAGSAQQAAATEAVTPPGPRAAAAVSEAAPSTLAVEATAETGQAVAGLALNGAAPAGAGSATAAAGPTPRLGLAEGDVQLVRAPAEPATGRPVAAPDGRLWLNQAAATGDGAPAASAAGEWVDPSRRWIRRTGDAALAESVAGGSSVEATGGAARASEARPAVVPVPAAIGVLAPSTDVLGPGTGSVPSQPSAGGAADPKTAAQPSAMGTTRPPDGVPASLPGTLRGLSADGSGTGQPQASAAAVSMGGPSAAAAPASLSAGTSQPVAAGEQTASAVFTAGAAVEPPPGGEPEHTAPASAQPAGESPAPAATRGATGGAAGITGAPTAPRTADVQGPAQPPSVSQPAALADPSAASGRGEAGEDGLGDGSERRQEILGGARPGRTETPAAPNRAAWAGAPVRAGAGGETGAPTSDVRGPATPVDPRVERVADVIASQARLVQYPNGDAEVRIRLQPERLGELHVRLQMENGQLSVSLAAANSSAKQLIESGLSQLQGSLQAQGVRLERLTVSVLASTGGHAAGDSLAQQQGSPQWAAGGQDPREQAGRWAGAAMPFSGLGSGAADSSGHDPVPTAPWAGQYDGRVVGGASSEQAGAGTARVMPAWQRGLTPSRVDYRV